MVIWELFEFGSQPHRHLSDEEVLTFVISGETDHAGPAQTQTLPRRLLVSALIHRMNCAEMIIY